MQKHIAILCLMALLLSVCGLSACGLSACGKTTVEDSTPSTDTTPQEETDTANTLAAQLQSIYADTGYGGYEYRIMGIQPGAHFYHKISAEANEIWYAEQTGDSYSDAVYTRNLLTEELLDVTITPIWQADRDAVGSQIQQAAQAGDDIADMALTSLAVHMTQATAGYLYNLHSLSAVQLWESWYDQDIVKNYSYKGNKLYCVTGAYNVFDDYGVPVIFYGKEILTKNGLTDPATLVPEGKWTLDVMMEMAETVTADTNGDGTMDAADTWGYLDNTDYYPHLLEGAGQPRTLVGDNGVPVLNVTSEAYINVGEKVYDLVVESNARFIELNATCRDIMKENRGLFYYELLGAINEFRDMESDFSLLPMPKADESNPRYTSAINPIWATAMAIPITVSDSERAGTVLDVLSAFSVETVDTTLNELLLGSKLVRDQGTLEMLSYVLDSKVYDWANGFSWASKIQSALNSQAKSNSFILASSMQSAAPAAQTALDEFLACLDVLP